MSTGSRIRESLQAATDPRLLQWPPSLLLVAMLTLYHLAASIDLGAAHLLIRLPIAVASMVPALFAIRAAHLLSRRLPQVRVPAVLASYVVGGALRGWLLEVLLDRTGVLPSGGAYRLLAGSVYVTVTAVLISIGWSTMEDSRVSIARLQQEVASLERSAIELQNASQAQDAERIVAMGQRISEQLGTVLYFQSDAHRDCLQALVKDVIRPLSRRFAPEPTPSIAANPVLEPVKWRLVFGALDPVKHLSKPAALVAIVLLAAMSSFATFHDVGTVAALSVAIALTLAASMYVTASVARQLLLHVGPALRGVVLGICFLAMALPPSLVTRLMLAHTANPSAYVIPGLLVIPALTGVLVISRASADYFTSITEEIARVHAQLRWSMARVNLVSWHRQGIISRLLHGPIQNNMQVAIMRLQSADDDEHLTIMSDVMARIEDAVRAAVDVDASPARDLAALQASISNWSGVARIHLDTSLECTAVLLEDPPACAIFVDAVMEACSNAIRHGGATNLDIAGSCTDHGVRIRVTDNGAWTVRTGGGLGTEMMAACSIAFDIVRVGSFVRRG